MKIVIAGLGPAGFAAAFYARKQNADAEITVIDEKSFPLMHNCFIPFAIAEIINIEEIKHDLLLERMNIKHITNADATEIISSKKQIKYKIKGSNSEQSEQYDKLIIATGAKTFVPPIPGLASAHNVFILDSYESVENCIRALKGKKSVLIIGAGAIGIEVAFAVKSLGIDVTVAEARGQIAPLAFDPEIASQVEEQMRAKGINLLLNAKVEKLENNSAYINGSAVSAELIVLATGVRSNHALAEKAGLRIGKFGIAVDEFLKTSDKDIYACGDCAEAFNFITKQPANAKLATVAYLQGICAGINAAGGRKKYIGTLCTFVSKFSTYEIASTGLTENYAKELGHDVISAKVNATAKPEAFPENNKILLKLVVDKKSRKILGCQAAGFGSTERINLVAQAIYAGISLEQLLDYENAYCPSVSKTFDLLKVCAELCVRKLNL